MANEDEKKEPLTMEAFAEAAKKVLDKIRGKRVESVNQSFAQTIAEQRARISKGVRTRQFLISDFWTADLLPWFQAECGNAMKPWVPGSADVPFSEGRINATYFFSSGKAMVLNLLLNTLNRWVEEGEEARKRLAYEEERRQELRESSRRA